MTGLNDLLKGFKKKNIILPSYQLDSDQIEKLNEIISENMNDEDIHYPDCIYPKASPNIDPNPLYLDPYGTRLFVMNNKLLIENYFPVNKVVKKVIEGLKLDEEPLKNFYRKIETEMKNA